MAAAAAGMWRAVVLLVLLAAGSAGALPVRWCAIGSDELAQCNRLVDTLGNTPGLEWSCVEVESAEECLAKVKTSPPEADIITLDGGDAYEAFTTSGMQAIVGEVYDGSSTAEYTAVAVVKESFCAENNGSVSLASLESKKSCHTGYGRTTGWNVPMGLMISQSLLTKSSDDDTVINAVENFFSSSCVPGEGDESICSGCATDCSDTGDYADYAGALRCLMEDGDVAFVKHTTPLEFASDGSTPEDWATLSKAELRLLCLEGGCQEVENWEECGLAVVPSHTVMLRRGYPAVDVEKIKSTLTNAAKSNANFRSIFLTGANENSLLFDSATINLAAVSDDTETHLGQSGVAYAALQGFDRPAVDANTARLCHITEEADSCEQLVTALNAVGSGSTTTEWSCVEREDTRECVEAVEEGAADITAIDAGEVWQAAFEYGLKPIVSEQYGDRSGEYYAVAIVRKEVCEDESVTFEALRGKNACHTGYRRTAGWMAPVGYLANAGFITPVSEDDSVPNDIESVDAFFNSVCAGGSEEIGRMCDLCDGDCSSTDPFYDYAGAFRCLMSGAGDVAFSKETTVAEYSSDGSSQQDWSSEPIENFRYMCPGGGCAEIGQHEECNLALVPAHAMVVSRAMPQSHLNNIKASLLAANDVPEFQAFLKANAENSHILSSSTTSLRDVSDQTIEEFLDSALAIYEGVQELDGASTHSPSPTSPAGSPPSSSPTPPSSTPNPPSSPSPSATSGTLRWCVTPEEESKCSSMATELNEVSGGVTYECVTQEDLAACVEATRSFEADIVVLDGGRAYDAWTKANLEAVVAETYEDAPNAGSEYYSVAVVKSETCDGKTTTFSLADLKGKKACSTGYGRSAGWTMPAGRFISAGLTDSNAESDIEALNGFFDTICAPGDDAEKRICELCAGDCGATTDPYSDYPGSLRCLTEGAGDVAFMKHTTATEYAQGGDKAQDWSSIPSSGYRLVCPNGGCRPIEDFEQCAMALVPAHAVMARSTLSDGLLSNIKNTLTRFADSSAFTNLFGEANNADGHVFDSDLLGLTAVDTSTEEFFGEAAIEAYSGVRALGTIESTERVRWCVDSKDDETKCKDSLVPALKQIANQLDWSCTKRDSIDECLAAVSEGNAEVVAVDGGKLYLAANYYNMKAIAAEEYGSSGPEYYGVAVVNADFCSGNVSMSDLKGKNSCHTGYGRTAGWLVPAGILDTIGMLDSNAASDIEAIDSFFAESCAPGSDEAKRLCDLCQGDCTSEDAFYDYDGAFQCLMNGGGDVAFIKHTTVEDYAADGNTPAEWAAKSKSEFKYLCPSGGCADIGDHGDCNLAAVPAHAVAVSRLLPSSVSSVITSALLAANNNDNFRGAFLEGNNPDGHVFTASTTRLVAVTNTEAFLGTAARAFDGVYALGNTSPEVVEDEGEGSSGLGGGAIAGIIIGSLAGVLIIAALVFFLCKRRGAAYKSQGGYKDGEGMQDGAMMSASAANRADRYDAATAV